MDAPAADAASPRDVTQDPGANQKPSGPTAAQAKLRKRTKTGCLTCRKRRIKCGEERPICNNCVKSKRNCEGYNQRVIWKPPIGDWPSHPGAVSTLQYHSGIIPGSRPGYHGPQQPLPPVNGPLTPIKPRPYMQYDQASAYGAVGLVSPDPKISLDTSVGGDPQYHYAQGHSPLQSPPNSAHQFQRSPLSAQFPPQYATYPPSDLQSPHALHPHYGMTPRWPYGQVSPVSTSLSPHTLTPTVPPPTYGFQPSPHDRHFPAQVSPLPPGFTSGPGSAQAPTFAAAHSDTPQVEIHSPAYPVPATAPEASGEQEHPAAYGEYHRKVSVAEPPAAGDPAPPPVIKGKFTNPQLNCREALVVDSELLGSPVHAFDWVATI